MAEETLPLRTPSQVEDEERRQRGSVPPYDPRAHRGQRRRRRDYDDDEDDRFSQSPPSPPEPPPYRDIVTQAWVMYGTNSVLLPWQMLPFHRGWEFQADAMRIRYKRLQVVVDENGEPVAESRQNTGSAAWADPSSLVSITYADQVYGFSGWGSRTERLTMRAAKHYQGLARVTDDPDINLWKPNQFTSEDVTVLRPVFYRAALPSFVPESLSECPGLQRLYCLKTGWRYVVPVELCHLVVSGEPGMNPVVLGDLKTKVGQALVNDEVFIGGVRVDPQDANPSNEDKPDEDRILIHQQAKFAGFSEEALLNADHEMRLFQWSSTPVMLAYSQPKAGPKKGKPGRKGSGNETQSPDMVRKIHELINRPNMDVLARVLPGLACGTRAAFGY